LLNEYNIDPDSSQYPIYSEHRVVNIVTLGEFLNMKKIGDSTFIIKVTQDI